MRDDLANSFSSLGPRLVRPCPVTGCLVILYPFNFENRYPLSLNAKNIIPKSIDSLSLKLFRLPFIPELFSHPLSLKLIVHLFLIPKPLTGPHAKYVFLGRISYIAFT